MSFVELGSLIGDDFLKIGLLNIVMIMFTVCNWQSILLGMCLSLSLGITKITCIHDYLKKKLVKNMCLIVYWVFIMLFHYSLD